MMVMMMKIIVSSLFAWTATAAISQNCDTSDDEIKQHGDNREDKNSCLNWPQDQIPLEHRDFSCNRSLQNIQLNALLVDAAAASDQDLIPSSVYLKLPEEKSWICPLESTDDAVSFPSSNNLNIDNFKERNEGHNTKWVLYNKASTPIILTYINALGSEVSATDGAYPAHSNTAVYPNGPIVLPGQMAVINGLQGHMFYAREYKEVVFSSLNGYDDGEDIDALLWKNAGVESFRKSLPPTLSFLPNQSRYTSSKGVTHVLGLSGRVLMKHRMGLIHVKNDSGAICPQSLGRADAVLKDEDESDGRKGNPRDNNPLCNVLRKAFINKVGCPVDIYFARQNKQGEYSMGCERYASHLGSLDDFVAADRLPDLDDHSSPLKFENSYNGHSFVVRMAHDQSFVSRIEINHDIVRDCPEPQNRGRSVASHTDDIKIINAVSMMETNSTDKSAHIISDLSNATSLSCILRENLSEDQRTCGFKSVPLHIAT